MTNSKVKEKYLFNRLIFSLIYLIYQHSMKIIITIINAENKVLIGRVNHFGRNQLRIDFLAPKDSKEKLTFEKILLKSEENEIN